MQMEMDELIFAHQNLSFLADRMGFILPAEGIRAMPDCGAVQRHLSPPLQADIGASIVQLPERALCVTVQSN
jgi:hypothetical protein